MSVLFSSDRHDNIKHRLVISSLLVLTATFSVECLHFGGDCSTSGQIRNERASRNFSGQIRLTCWRDLIVVALEQRGIVTRVCCFWYLLYQVRFAGDDDCDIHGILDPHFMLYISHYTDTCKDYGTIPRALVDHVGRSVLKISCHPAAFSRRKMSVPDIPRKKSQDWESLSTISI